MSFYSRSARQDQSSRSTHKRNHRTPPATSSTRCQNCFEFGHWTFECKSDPVYLKRPSRSKILSNPKLQQKFRPSVKPPDAEKSYLFLFFIVYLFSNGYSLG